nr:hypothetical protein [Tanacetum cinerariifolium]
MNMCQGLMREFKRKARLHQTQVRVYANGLLLLVEDLLLLLQVKLLDNVADSGLRLLEESAAADEKIKE